MHLIPDRLRAACPCVVTPCENTAAQAFLMLATTSFSLLFSLAFFLPLLAVLGPQGKTGTLHSLAAHCARPWQNSSSETTRPQEEDEGL